jgi:RecA-family ATPase
LPAYTLAQCKALDKPAWLVFGLIVASLTIVSGKPKSGKSALVLNLVMCMLQNLPFLGREVAAVDRILIVATDADAVVEYRDRLLAAGVSPQDAGERLLLVPATRLDAEFCAQFGEELRPGKGDVVIFDHLSDMAGDFNSQADVSAVFAAIRNAASEASVIVLAHSSTATGQHGFSPTKPLGSTVIAAKARWLLHVEDRGSNERRITTSGNGARGETIQLAVGSHVADLSVLEVVTAEQKQEKRKIRSTKTLDKRAQQVDWYQQNCVGLSKAEGAKKLAEQFGGNARTWQNHLSPSGWAGEMLVSRSHALTDSPPNT